MTANDPARALAVAALRDLADLLACDDQLPVPQSIALQHSAEGPYEQGYALTWDVWRRLTQHHGYERVSLDSDDQRASVVLQFVQRVDVEQGEHVSALYTVYASRDDDEPAAAPAVGAPDADGYAPGCTVDECCTADVTLPHRPGCCLSDERTGIVDDD